MRETIAKIVDAATFMVLGGWLVAGYLGKEALAGHPYLDDGLMFSFYALLLISGYVRPQPDHRIEDLSPAVSGTAVVIVVGIAVVVALVWYGALKLAAGAFILTAFAASRVWAFATTHRGEIGEARFSSDPKAS